MGEVAGRLADVLVVTDDNPRSEDPAAIRAEVLAGAEGGPAEVHEVGDRRRGDPARGLAGRGRATASWWPARATRPARRSPAPCTPSTTGSALREALEALTRRRSASR